MAQKVQVVFTDDVDGGEADETVKFSLDGVNYEIDLSEDNATALRAAFGEWVASARRTGGRSTRKVRDVRREETNVVQLPPSGKAVRAWAESAGVECPARGRIPVAVMEQYAAAH